MQFSDAYKINCRAIWYANGCPSPQKLIDLNILPLDERGQAPGASSLRHWVEEEGWHQWKDALNAELSMRTEDELLNDKVALIKEQLAQNNEIRNKAFQDIKEKPFDSSAAAVSAFFKASAEERGLMQIQKVIEDLAKLQTPDLQQRFRELAERAGSTIIDVKEEKEEKEEVAEPLD